jgi:hypothetical protein|tara:strand:+ start:1667 stop:2233 length:567 start_codon:yes stop_codon:yes gene_type:complete
MQPRQRTETNEAEIRLMGLILSQSALVGLAVGIFDAGIWLTNDTEFVNGLTYAMGAFAVQGLAYYFFKMFFEHNMQERAQSADMERQRQNRYRGMQNEFDNRRSEMELRMQEGQMEAELRWMEANPGKMPPSWGIQGGQPLFASQFESKFNPGVPMHVAEIQQPINLGAGDEKNKSDGTPDKRYKKKE